MVSGSKLSPEIHWIVIRLSARLTQEDILTYTGISIAAVHNILNYFKKYQTIRAGKDGEEKERKKLQGQLRDVDVQVHHILFFYSMLTEYQYLLDRVERSPDLYLDELQELLARDCGATASLATVWRKLRLAGLTKKKVCNFRQSRLTFLKIFFNLALPGCRRTIRRKVAHISIKNWRI